MVGGNKKLVLALDGSDLRWSVQSGCTVGDAPDLHILPMWVRAPCGDPLLFISDRGYEFGFCTMTWKISGRLSRYIVGRSGPKRGGNDICWPVEDWLHETDKLCEPDASLDGSGPTVDPSRPRGRTKS